MGDKSIVIIVYRIATKLTYFNTNYTKSETRWMYLINIWLIPTSPATTTSMPTPPNLRFRDGQLLACLWFGWMGHRQGLLRGDVLHYSARQIWLERSGVSLWHKLSFPRSLTSFNVALHCFKSCATWAEVSWATFLWRKPLIWIYMILWPSLL